MIIPRNILNDYLNICRIFVRSKKIMDIGIMFMQILSELKSSEIDDLYKKIYHQ